MEMKVIQEPPSGCEGCGSRRDFLRDAAGVLAGVLLGLGASAERVQAIPIETATPLHVAGPELTLAVPSADGATVYAAHSLILARYAGAVYAFSLACPHQRAALRWLGPQGRFQCSKHKSRYRPDGVYVSGRATRGMDRFALRRHEGNVVVDLSRRLREDEEREAWSAALVRVR
ncbi:MAG TPA: Rieske (2Fe-2S) protein [Longimicrobium sp.]|nr:Rieske (2Fe-2S) protein [Longimicrobium sp.]